MSLIAWLSLGVQVQVLIGSRGLLPVADFIEAARGQPGVSLLRPADAVLVVPLRRRAAAGHRAGRRAVARARCSASRAALCFALSTLLYLSLRRRSRATSCRSSGTTCCSSAASSPRSCRTDRPRAARPLPVPAGAVQALLRVGHRQVAVAAARLARRQRDDLLLRDRAAADLARLVTRTTCPSGGTTSRAGRRWCSSWSSRSRSSARAGCACSPLAAFTLFQIVNAATANYGFFCYLAVGARRLPARRRRRRARARAPRARARFVPARLRRLGARVAALRARAAAPAPPARCSGRRARRGLAVAGAALFALVSLADALVALRRAGPGAVVRDPAARAQLAASTSSTPTTCSRRSRASASSPNSRRWPTARPTAREADDAAWTAAAPPAQAGRRPRARPTSWRRTSRASTSSSGSTASPSSAAPPAVRLDAARATVRGSRRPCSRCFARRCPPHPAAVRLVYWQYQFTSRRRAARHRRLVATDAPRDHARAPVPCP